jgi:hypothetical protein
MRYFMRQNDSRHLVKVIVGMDEKFICERNSVMLLVTQSRRAPESAAQSDFWHVKSCESRICATGNIPNNVALALQSVGQLSAVHGFIIQAFSKKTRKIFSIYFSKTLDTRQNYML